MTFPARSNLINKGARQEMPIFLLERLATSASVLHTTGLFVGEANLSFLIDETIGPTL
ncbi:MAG: hypothetical protein ABJM26_19345 [Anderseniella sp.]